MALILRLAVLFAALLASPVLFAGGGPLGIDHEMTYDNTDIWRRVDQNVLQYGAIAVTASIALWEGGDSRLGRTAWQTIDALAVSTALSYGAKEAFGRVRPRDGNDPDLWGRKHNYSFPSGEVTSISAIVTPYILEYRHDHPSVYALEILPAYDGIARMKVHAHWQTDVLAGFALGTAVGYYAHKRESPLALSVMPHAVAVGINKRF